MRSLPPLLIDSDSSRSSVILDHSTLNTMNSLGDIMIILTGILFIVAVYAACRSCLTRHRKPDVVRSISVNFLWDHTCPDLLTCSVPH